MRSDLTKLDPFTSETSKNHLIRNFLRSGRLRVKRNRQFERNQSKFLPLQETLEQEKRARADSEQRITKPEMKNSDDVRKNEDCYRCLTSVENFQVLKKYKNK